MNSRRVTSRILTQPAGGHIQGLPAGKLLHDKIVGCEMELKGLVLKLVCVPVNETVPAAGDVRDRTVRVTKRSLPGLPRSSCLK